MKKSKPKLNKNQKNILMSFFCLTLMQAIFIVSGFLKIDFKFDFGIALNYFNPTEMIIAFGISLLILGISYFEDSSRVRFMVFSSAMCFTVFLSYFSFSSSLLVNKFIFVTNIVRLKTNYDFFRTGEIIHFLKNTLPLHQGDSESAGLSFFYLVPLFLSILKCGGLSLLNLSVFNAFCCINALFVFYLFAKKHYGKCAAFSAVLLFSFSHYFQFFLRSSSYMGMSLLVAMIFLYAFYESLEKNRAVIVAAFCLFIAFYFYGPLRYFFFLPLFWLKNSHKRNRFFSFYLWFFIFIAPFAYLGIRNGMGIFDEEHIFVYSTGYEYGENLKEYFSKMGANFDLTAFLQHALNQAKKNTLVLNSLFNKDLLKVNPHHTALFSYILLPFFICGIIKAFKDITKDIYGLLLFSATIVFVMPFVLTSDPLQVRRIMLWPIFVFLFSGIGFASLTNIFKHNFLNKLMFLFLTFCLSLHTIKEIRDIFYFLPHRNARLEFFYEKKALENNYADRNELMSLFRNYFVSKAKPEEVASVILKMTTAGDDLKRDSVASVERYMPDTALPGDNRSFFTENFLDMWGAHGDAFKYQPVSTNVLNEHPDKHLVKGQTLIHTFYQHKNKNSSLIGDSPIGTITSPLFIIEKRYLKFVFGGGPTVNERMELLIDGHPAMWISPDFDNRLKNITWDLEKHIGREARICIVDYSGQPGGFVIVADMRFED